MTDVSIRTLMFQGWFPIDSDIDRVTANIENPLTRVSCFDRDDGCMLKGLHMHTVKFAKKGRLGDVLYTWHEGDQFVVPPTLKDMTGSIQIACTTVPYNLKVSIFVFTNGKVKICGALIDSYTAGMMWYQHNKGSCATHNIMFDYDSLNSGIQAYLDDVKLFVCELLGAVPDTLTFFPGFLNGQFDFGMRINNVNQLALFASRTMQNLFRA